jgi:DNA-binding MarR family transcriptional regulator
MESSARPDAGQLTDILDDFRRIVRVLRESSRAAEGVLGVTGAQLFVLKALADAPALSVNALAERTRTHQSTVSVVVKRLVERGFVRRETSESDGRRVELTLTKRGVSLLAQAPLAAQDKLISSLEKLPVQDRKALASALKQVVHSMSLESDSPQMFFEEDEASAEK